MLYVKHIDITDVTVKFKDRLFNNKLHVLNFDCECERSELNRFAYANITYKTSMPIYENVVQWGPIYLRYFTQTKQIIDNEQSILNLN